MKIFYFKNECYSKHFSVVYLSYYGINKNKVLRQIRSVLSLQHRFKTFFKKIKHGNTLHYSQHFDIEYLNYPGAGKMR